MTDPVEPSTHLKDVVFVLDRYGVTLATAVFLGWLLLHQLRDMKWQLDRSIRNERAIMQKLEIPIVLDSDRATS